MKKITRTWALALAATALCTWTACSGGGSGGGGSAMYTVGGLVTGMNGEAMVLQLNGDQDITVTSNGAFVFDGELPEGTAYNVQVVSGPCDNVRITNGSGTLTGEVRDIAVHCVRWNNPIDTLDTMSPQGSEAYSQSLAMNAGGDAILAWEQEGENGNYHTFVAHRKNGTWTKPVDLSDFVSMETVDAWDVDVAIADNGDAVVAYTMDDDDSGYNRIYLSEYRGGVWTHSETFFSGISRASANASSPTVAMYPNGDTIVVWREYIAGRYSLLMSEFRNGAWTHPSATTTPFSPAGQSAYEPRIATSANGEAIIAWQQSDGVRNQIFKSEFRNSTWTHPAGLSDNISPDGQHANEPRVAFAANGEAVLVWRQLDGSRYQIFKSEFRNSTWTHPTGVADNISPNGQHAYGPDVAMAPNGDTVIAWRQYSGDRYLVYKSEFRNSAWTHPADLDDSSSTGGQVDEVRVAMSQGGAVIGYIADYGSYENCFALHYRDGAWQPAVRLAPVYTSCEEPTVAMAANGESMVAWYAYIENITYQVFLSHYH